MKHAILMSNDKNRLASVYSEKILSQIKSNTELYPDIIAKGDIENFKDVLAKTEIIFSTWGMPAFTETEIDTYFPKLEIIFYAAGTVQGFAHPFLNKGIQVMSAAAANAIPTAEFASAQIFLANKGYFQTALKLKTESYQAASQFHNQFPGNYNIKIGILGAGAVGSNVIRILKTVNDHLDILVYDPFLSDEKAKASGVTKTDLKTIFSECETISNHLANNEATQRLITKEHFNLMKATATFINTGRGQQIAEEDLIAALKEVPTRTAVLDVTYPEPPTPDSELLTLSNVFLTPHIAGSKDNEFERMSQFAVDELSRYLNHEPLKYSVTLEMLKTMA